MGLNAASEYTHAEKLLTRGKAEAQAIGAAGGTYTIDLLVPGESTLVVQADMTGAANADLGVIVTPFEADGLTVSGVNLAASRSVGPTFAGGRVTSYMEFDVSALDKVRVTFTNNNAGAQTLTRVSWRLF